MYQYCCSAVWYCLFVQVHSWSVYTRDLFALVLTLMSLVILDGCVCLVHSLNVNDFFITANTDPMLQKNIVWIAMFKIITQAKLRCLI